ncbi:MAG: hypothetical protein Q8N42_00020 [bacterium]|nr:hypothetical protein [bacterium]
MEKKEQFDFPRKKIAEELSEEQLDAYREGRLKSQLEQEHQEAYREGRRIGAFLMGIFVFLLVLLVLWFRI